LQKTKRKKQVEARWKVKEKTPSIQFIPFAIENTGGLGESARELLYQILDIPKAPPEASLDFAAANIRRERIEKFQVLNRFKAAITASVWKGNHFIYNEYVRSLKAVPPKGDVS